MANRDHRTDRASQSSSHSSSSPMMEQLEPRLMLDSTVAVYSPLSEPFDPSLTDSSQTLLDSIAWAAGNSFYNGQANAIDESNGVIHLELGSMANGIGLAGVQVENTLSHSFTVDEDGFYILDYVLGIDGWVRSVGGTLFISGNAGQSRLWIEGSITSNGELAGYGQFNELHYEDADVVEVVGDDLPPITVPT